MRATSAIPRDKGATAFDASKGQYRITGSGANIWAKQDQFQYVWREMTGNFSVTATMGFLGKGEDHRKADMTRGRDPGRVPCLRCQFVDIHRTEFKRLGILGRWEDPYLTMSAEYEAVIAQAFVDFLDSGYVYKGLKPVHWCIKDRTALAEAEVEYENHSSPSIYVRFTLTSDPAAHRSGAGRQARFSA